MYYWYQNLTLHFFLFIWLFCTAITTICIFLITIIIIICQEAMSLCSHNLYKSTGSYTAVSRKVVRKSARDNPERYCGWFLVHCFSTNFQRMAREAMDICLRVLKESNKSRFDSYSVRNKSLIISLITFRHCRVHSFCDKLSRNSCIQLSMCWPFPFFFLLFCKSYD